MTRDGIPFQRETVAGASVAKRTREKWNCDDDTWGVRELADWPVRAQLYESCILDIQIYVLIEG